MWEHLVNKILDALKLSGQNKNNILTAEMRICNAEQIGRNLPV
jgi:hypothetical protein